MGNLNRYLKMAKQKGITAADEHIEGVLTMPASVINKAAKSKHGKTLGALLFIAGFLIAALAGLLAGAAAAGMNVGMIQANDPMLLGLMALIGLIVGLVNVSDKEAINFLIGAIAITVAAGAMAPLANVGGGVTGVVQATNFVAAFIGGMMQMVAAFVAPAALVVGLKVVYSAAREA